MVIIFVDFHYVFRTFQIIQNQIEIKQFSVLSRLIIQKKFKIIFL